MRAGRSMQDALAEAVHRSGRVDALLPARCPRRDRMPEHAVR